MYNYRRSAAISLAKSLALRDTNDKRLAGAFNFKVALTLHHSYIARICLKARSPNAAFVILDCAELCLPQPQNSMCIQQTCVYYFPYCYNHTLMPATPSLCSAAVAHRKNAVYIICSHFAFAGRAHRRPRTASRRIRQGAVLHSPLAFCSSFHAALQIDRQLQ